MSAKAEHYDVIVKQIDVRDRGMGLIILRDEAKPVVVINKRDAAIPVPQDQIERVRGGTPGVARDDDAGIALRDRGLGQVLRRDRLA